MRKIKSARCVPPVCPVLPAGALFFSDAGLTLGGQLIAPHPVTAFNEGDDEKARGRLGALLAIGFRKRLDSNLFRHLGEAAAHSRRGDHSGLPNRLSLHTSYGIWPDPAIIDYTLFRSLVPTMATCWQPRVCIACPNDLIKHRTQVGPYNEAWILYIPPDLAKTVQTGGVPVVETAPDGGLLLVATTEPFKTDNPVHLEGARKVALAARHLHTGADAEAHKPPPVAVPPKLPTLSMLSPEVIAQLKRGLRRQLGQAGRERVRSVSRATVPEWRP